MEVGLPGAKRFRYQTGNSPIDTGAAFPLEGIGGAQVFGGQGELSCLYAHVVTDFVAELGADPTSLFIMAFDLGPNQSESTKRLPLLCVEVPKYHTMVYEAPSNEVVVYGPDGCAVKSTGPLGFLRSGVEESKGLYCGSGLRVYASSTDLSLSPVSDAFYITNAEYRGLQGGC